MQDKENSEMNEVVEGLRKMKREKVKKTASQYRYN